MNIEYCRKCENYMADDNTTVYCGVRFRIVDKNIHSLKDGTLEVMNCPKEAKTGKMILKNFISSVMQKNETL